jgi:hypothetical protein
LELQCRPNIEDAHVDHIEQIERQVKDILSRQTETSTTPTSPAEVRKIIGSLKVKKTPGPDNIPNKVIAGQSCRRFDHNNQRQPATLPLSFSMEEGQRHFHSEARERFEISPQSSADQSPIFNRISSRKSHSDPSGQSD